MARTPAPFATDAEFALLEEIWNNGKRTVRQLVDELYPTATPSDLATVQKLLKRLEDKGLINRDRGVSPQVVTPSKDRMKMAKQELNAVAAKYGMKLSELVNA